MKKILIVLCAALVLLCVASCGKQAKETAGTTADELSDAVLTEAQAIQTESTSKPERIELPPIPLTTAGNTTKSSSGTTNASSGTTNAPSGTTKAPSGTTKAPSGTTKAPSGTTKPEATKNTTTTTTTKPSTTGGFTASPRTDPSTSSTTHSGTLPTEDSEKDRFELTGITLP